MGRAGQVAWPAILGLAALALLARSAGACAPWFPPSILTATWEQFEAAPETRRVEVELTRLLGRWREEPSDMGMDYHSGAQIAQTYELVSLRAALQKGRVAPEEVDRLTRGLGAVRDALVSWPAASSWDTPQTGFDTIPGDSVVPALPDGLPPEFAHYLAGAIAWRRGHADEARCEWRACLALPGAQRRYRAVWAQYMLARSGLETAPAQAADGFERVRALVTAGFDDPMGLADDSLHWEARARLALGQVPAAVTLHLQQLRHHLGGSVADLEATLEEALGCSATVLDDAARDPATRRLLTAEALTRHQATPAWVAHLHGWLEALERSGASDVDEADCVAWMAYDTGDMEAASRWLERAPPTPEAAWLRSRLLVRQGRFDEAAAQLAFAVEALRGTDTWIEGIPIRGYFPGFEEVHGRIRGELATCRLAAGDFRAAFDELVRGGYWIDAGYVADRILTPQELLDLARSGEWRDACRATPVGGVSGMDDDWSPGACVARFRSLVARRMTRLGRFDDAMPFSARQDVLARLARGLQAGHDSSRTSEARARALFDAARVTNAHGMLLVASETDPDWAVLEGNFELPPVQGQRLVGECQAEEQRAAASAMPYTERWHHHWAAADLAWEGAHLLPHDSKLGAEMLARAGTWLSRYDTHRADAFYKELAVRWGRTQLGREAARLHWFPPLDDP